jgi:hypothetical protein
MKSFNLLLLILLLSLAACAKPATIVPTATLLPTATATAAPTAAPTVSLTYGDMAQFELVTPAGRHIYIDVYNVSLLTREPTSDDILLTTHTHDDHYYPSFQANFPGQQLFTSEGKIELDDVTITGIAAAHNYNNPIQAEKASNYIYIIDVAGLRIAHFGDIGQDALTDDQLAALGKVDVALTQFSNSFSTMNGDNLKGFNLMDQLNPRLVIPTHDDQATIKIATERWKGYFSDQRTVTFSADSLPPERSILVLGNLAFAYGTLFNLEAWK